MLSTFIRSYLPSNYLFFVIILFSNCDCGENNGTIFNPMTPSQLTLVSNVKELTDTCKKFKLIITNTSKVDINLSRYTLIIRVEDTANFAKLRYRDNKSESKTIREVEESLNNFFGKEKLISNEKIEQEFELENKVSPLVIEVTLLPKDKSNEKEGIAIPGIFVTDDMLIGNGSSSWRDILQELQRGDKTNIDKLDKAGAAALHYACKYAKKKIVEVLLYNGANPNIENKDKNTPLHLAVQHDKVKIPILLLLTGAYAYKDAENKYKFTPLHYAASKGNIAAVEILLAIGADKNVINHAGKKPVDLTTDDAIRRLLL